MDTTSKPDRTSPNHNHKGPEITKRLLPIPLACITDPQWTTEPETIALCMNP